MGVIVIVSGSPEEMFNRGLMIGKRRVLGLCSTRPPIPGQPEIPPYPLSYDAPHQKYRTVCRSCSDGRPGRFEIPTGGIQHVVMTLLFFHQQITDRRSIQATGINVLTNLNPLRLICYPMLSRASCAPPSSSIKPETSWIFLHNWKRSGGTLSTLATTSSG